MTGTNRSSDGLDARRRKLLFRSRHRGMRELDLILGSFADAEIARLNAAEIDQYEKLLDIPDTDLIGVVMGERVAPPENDTPMLRRVISFSRQLTFPTAS